MCLCVAYIRNIAKGKAFQDLNKPANNNEQCSLDEMYILDVWLDQCVYTIL